jgi:hypothetical protein
MNLLYMSFYTFAATPGIAATRSSPTVRAGQLNLDGRSSASRQGEYIQKRARV